MIAQKFLGQGRWNSRHNGKIILRSPPKSRNLWPLPSGHFSLNLERGKKSMHLPLNLSRKMEDLMEPLHYLQTHRRGVIKFPLECGSVAKNSAMHEFCRSLNVHAYISFGLCDAGWTGPKCFMRDEKKVLILWDWSFFTNVMVNVLSDTILSQENFSACLTTFPLVHSFYQTIEKYVLKLLLPSLYTRCRLLSFPDKMGIFSGEF